MTIPIPLSTAGQDLALFQEVLAQASRGGSELMVKLVSATRRSLSEREDKSRDLHERDQLVASRSLLDKLAPELGKLYSAELSKAFAEDTQPVKAAKSSSVVAADVRFDQLELMDEGQVDESVQLARSQQTVLLGADAALADVNALICAAQGLKTVRSESNPLRPSAYVSVLLACLTQLQVPGAMRQDWMRTMCGALGGELAQFYVGVSHRLRTHGVAAAGYAVIRTAMSSQATAPAGASVASSATSKASKASKETSLTLNKLRRLLSGELDSPEVGAPQSADSESNRLRAESFASRFSREFEGDSRNVSDEPAQASSVNDFHPTVPAAFEALTEMRQVDQVMKQIQRRQGAEATDSADSLGTQGGVRQHLRQMARGLGQTLSLEVVALMVDNIACDPRLLAAIAQIVRSLEPPLLRLALVDPRFFSDKLHPARRLLQEITQRSLAFDSEAARGFASFLSPLQEAIEPLVNQPIESAEPFELVLNALTEVWDENALRAKQELEKAMAALRHAEDRNFLAEKMAAEIRARPDAKLVDADVMNFLCSPWAQVIAQARLADPSGGGANPSGSGASPSGSANPSGSADPGQFIELISVLMWSAQPDLTRKNISELTRLVPKLLSKLREGLDTISYPSVKTSAFFEALMNLHQLAFKPANLVSRPEVASATLVAGSGMESTKPQLLSDDADPWLAPVEAKVSGFMEIPAVAPPAPASMTPDMLNLDDLLNAAAPPVIAELPMGTWVELFVNGKWARTQLSWASPHGTLFLFTSAFGSTQSMSLRSRNKMLANGTMRVISSQHLVDGALDAVAHTAMLNSLEDGPALL